VRVTCLDISPAGGILVTGCEDGVARVWAFGRPGDNSAASNINNSSSSSSSSTRSRAPVTEGRLAQLRGVLEEGDLRDLEAVLNQYVFCYTIVVPFFSCDVSICLSLIRVLLLACILGLDRHDV
jgi:hypothetical protein